MPVDEEVIHSDGSYVEEEDQETAIQDNIFQQYLEVCDEAEVDEETDVVFAKGLLRVREYLAAGQDNCLICLGNIKPTEAIWHCEGSCYALFHLPCIQEWARNQLASAAYKASREAELGAAAAAAGSSPAPEWGCPKCRFCYSPAQLPSSYSCFCGKQEEPEWDPWLAPHSCGELCGKQLPGKCQHSCLLLCHPGPCPPCPLLVDAACYCGKTRMKQRCGNNEYSCRAVCGKLLPCGHKCPEMCHPGNCPPCQEVGTYRCACGTETAQLPCCQSNWHCTKPCAKTLACGRHVCQDVCHAGPCGGCPEEGERRCPCGKATYTDISCDEKAPLCGGTCGKLLDCGAHTCQERCHYGPCTKVCRELVTKTCRCGRSQKQVVCSTEVRCESKCGNVRACGRHACKRRCCDGNCPPCEEVCNRKLRCGNHRCPAPCHSGPCRPCPLAQTISCACGKTSYSLPCGAEAAAAPPRCVQKCLVAPTCRHAAATKPHRCHFGPCPPCRFPCGTSLACGHTCSSSSCHDAAPPPIADFQKPKPPKSQAQSAATASKKAAAAAAQEQQQHPAAAAAAAAAAMMAAGEALRPCPACCVPVEIQCVGGHAKQAFACHSVKPFSCSRSCGQPLPCGNHTCTKPCHATAGAAAGAAAAAGSAAAAEACEVCTRPCSRPRSCSHPCPSSCHPGACAACEVKCTVGCHCGKTTLNFPCWEFEQIHQQQQQGTKGKGGSGAAAAAAAAADPLCCGKPCHKQLPYCPHPCRAECHVGACPDAEGCNEEVTVRCSCRRLKQKWPCAKVQAALAAAAAAGRRGYDGATVLKLLPCDGECAAQQRSKGEQQQQVTRGSSPEEGQRQQQQQQEAAVAATAAATAAAKSVGAKKLSRAEREALAAQREAERLEAERVQKMKQRAIVAAVLLIVLLLGWGLARGVQKLLMQVDDVLRDKYDPTLQREL